MEEKVPEHHEAGQLGDKKDTTHSNRSAGFFFSFNRVLFSSFLNYRVLFLLSLMFPSFFLFIVANSRQLFFFFRFLKGSIGSSRVMRIAGSHSIVTGRILIGRAY